MVIYKCIKMHPLAFCVLKCELNQSRWVSSSPPPPITVPLMCCCGPKACKVFTRCFFTPCDFIDLWALGEVLISKSILCIVLCRLDIHTCAQSPAQSMTIRKHCSVGVLWRGGQKPADACGAADCEAKYDDKFVTISNYFLSPEKNLGDGEQEASN